VLSRDSRLCFTRVPYGGLACSSTSHNCRATDDLWRDLFLPNMSDTGFSGNTRTRKGDFLSLFKKSRVVETTEDEGSRPGLASVNSQSAVGQISSTSSGLQPFQSQDHSRSPSDMVVGNSRPYKA